MNILIKNLLAKSLIALFAAVSILVVNGCTQAPPYRESRFLMGTLIEIVAYPPTDRVKGAVDGAFSRMEEIEAMADHRREGSALETLHSSSDAELPEEMVTVISAALSFASASSGAFDPTMGKVVSLWGFDRDAPGLPEKGELAKALKTVGYERLRLNGSRVQADGPVWLDLGGIAKGYAVDEAVKYLQEDHVQSGIVNAGGDLRVFGKKPGREAWKIGVQDPDDHQGLAGVMTVKSGAVATSGDYERYFETGGKRYHHILDPSTGYPADSGLRSVTILAQDCLTADSLATAVFVLGSEKGLRLLKNYKGSEAVLITVAGDILTTDGVEDEKGFERK